ncbi:MAG: PHP domain-containing protein [Chloroflexi bacterium]|nr:PHP domain-containing protein [Chloroflexota bacterium]
MTSKVDLHAHTTASDGVLSPEELVSLALERGLEVIAITDHDTTEGISPALRATEGTSLVVISGIEISTDIPRTEVHILGYFVNWRNRQFQQKLVRLRRSRVDRAKRMVAKLRELGMPVQWQRVLEIAGSGTIGRPHVAQALYERGFVSSPVEAFAKYIGRNGPAYVERYKLTPTEAVKLISSTNGLAALAHPVIVPQPGAETGEQIDLEWLLPQLVDAGLVGMETFYAGYTTAITQRLLDIAHRYHLVPTGGSDFHGRGGYTADLGEIEVPRSTIDALQARLGQRGR